jgi:cytochrome c oxidase assembly protein subunit 11
LDNNASFSQTALDRKHRKVAGAAFALVCLMVGLSFAAVPFYKIFCQVTGYGGTTRRVESNEGTVLDKTITVRFDSNTASGLPWEFKPVEHTIDVKIGENRLAFFRAKNTSKETIRGTATFNVTPEIVGSYFNKIECFCFTEQVLAPGQSVDMPVSFFIDPEIVNDGDARGVREITLSYTFFPVKKVAETGKTGTNGS